MPKNFEIKKRIEGDTEIVEIEMLNKEKKPTSNKLKEK